jgi:V8-like Glu-specific endopeptidase
MLWRTLSRWLRSSHRRPARSYRRLSPEPLEERLTLSVNLVADTTSYPWRAVVRIEAHFPKEAADEFIQGTGAMIDPFHVLTAGHVVYDAPEGGWPDQIKVIPGEQGAASAPFGVAYGTLERTYQNFVNNDNQGTYDEHGDVGLITLDRALGDTTGWFAYGYNDDDSYFQGLGLNTAGYPGDQGYDGYHQYRQYGPISGPSADGQILSWNYSSLSSIAGQSGSPLWVYDATTNERTLYAVLDSGNDATQTGYASRITSSVYNDLQSWIALDPAPGPAHSPSNLQHNTFTLGAPPNGPGSSSTGGGTLGGRSGVQATQGDGIGVVDPATATWYLNTHAAAGAPDEGTFQYGAPGWVPVIGNWSGGNRDGIGMFDPATGTWYLRNHPNAGFPDAGVFQYGAPGWIPLAGDWNGDGKTGIGVFDPSTATFYLRKKASAGPPDAGMFAFGAPGWMPVVGNWDGGPRTHIGVFDSTTAHWYLRNENSAGAPDAGSFAIGAPGWQPIVGHWNGIRATIGVIDPTTMTWYLHNNNSAGALSTPPFAYGAPFWVGVAGSWQGTSDVALSLKRKGPEGVFGPFPLPPDSSAGGGKPSHRFGAGLASRGKGAVPHLVHRGLPRTIPVPLIP